MLRKLGKKMTNNFGLKILAALFAIALWIVVVNIDDPLVTKSYTTSVVPINESYITSQGKYYEWLDGNNTISFKVSALRSIIAKLSNADFSASADMEKIEYDEESESYRVPVTISTAKYGSEEVAISTKQLYLEVALEDLGVSQKAIVATTKGTVADGCAIGDLQIIGSNVLKISGPLSIVSQIDTAAAVINVDGMSTDVTDSVVPVLYDAGGNQINTTKLKLSLSTVTISAQILNTKDVELEFDTTGEVADGYMITDIEYDLDNIRIKGEGATLNPINKITIPAEVLDVTDLTEDLVTTVDITSYLPSGASLVLKTDAKIEVRVRIEPIATEVFELPVTRLKVENLRDGSIMEYGIDIITVEVGGPESVVSDMTAKDITGTVDLSGLGSGEHQAEVTFTFEKEKCWTAKTVRVPVTVVGTEHESNGDPNAEETSDAQNGSGDAQTGGTGGTAGAVTDTQTPDAADQTQTSDEAAQGENTGGTQTP